MLTFNKLRSFAVFGCDVSMAVSDMVSLSNTPSQLAVKTIVVSASVICLPDWSVPDYSWATSCQGLSKAFFSLFFMNMNHECDIPSVGFIYSRAPSSKVGPLPNHIHCKKKQKNNGRLEEVGSPYCTVLIRAHLHPTLPEA